MLTIYSRGASGRIERATDPAAALASRDFVWADLHGDPSDPAFRTSEEAIEQAFGIDAPTPAERMALEESARFFEEEGALFLTATVMGQRAEGAFITDAVTFILVEGRLVTVRTINPRAFTIGPSRASARIENAQDGAGVLFALLDGIVERAADILQESTREANALSAKIFVLEKNPGGLQEVLRNLGRLGALAALCHDSLSSLRRLANYAETVCDRHGMAAAQLRSFAQDVAELERAAEVQIDHVQFLLDAAVGLVGVAQNNILKALALATIAFAPPTLVASIFGMNFDAMHWFRADWGPVVGFALIVAAPMALFAIARWRRWF